MARVVGRYVLRPEHNRSIPTAARQVRPRSAWTLERLREIGAPKIVEVTGFSRSAVFEVLRGAKPHPRNQVTYARAIKEME
jgi:hypothetical protein